MDTLPLTLTDVDSMSLRSVCLTIHNVVSIYSDGRVVVNPNIDIDQAAKQFWDAVERYLLAKNNEPVSERSKEADS